MLNNSKGEKMNRLLVSIFVLNLLFAYSQEIVFKENKGQFPPQIVARVEGTDAFTYLTQRGISYQFGSKKGIDFYFKNGSQLVEVEKVAPTNHVSVFHRKGKSIFDVRDYQKIIYKQVYDGIDVHFYSKGNHMEYDFVVQPFASVENIQLEINASSIYLNENGDLILESNGVKMIHQAPIAHQGQTKIDSWWKIIDEKTVALETGNYDPSMELIIDPVVFEWEESYQYFGYETKIENSVLDENDNIYVVGTAVMDNTEETDIFVRKINQQGEPVLSLFLGDNYEDKGYGIALDSEGNIFISGILKAINNDENAYLVKLSSTGQILWEENFGQSNITNIQDIALRCQLDKNDNLYVAGQTRSTNMATAGAYQETMNSNTNTFIAKYNKDLELEWRTYYLFDYIADFRIDTSGNGYLLGRDGGTTIALAKFSPAGQLIWNSGNHIGRFSIENRSSVAVSPDGTKVCFVGSTNLLSTQHTTQGVHQSTFSGIWDGIITVLDSAGNRTWASYFGGINSDFANSCAINNEGEVLVAGNTNSTEGIATVGSYQVVYPNFHPTCLYLSKFSNTGLLDFGTYYFNSNNVNVQATSSYFANQSGFVVTSFSGKGNVMKFNESGLTLNEHVISDKCYLFEEKGLFYICNKSEKEILQVKILDVSGKEVESLSIQSGVNQVDFSKLKRGIHFMYLPDFDSVIRFDY